MTVPTTDPTYPVALESFKTWRGLGATYITRITMLAMQDGETSFRVHVLGDKDKAYNDFQWHWVPRGEDILKNTGIDIRTKTVSNVDQIKAAFWEMNHADGYRHVFSDLQAATTLFQGVTVAVHEYERSKNQQSDIAKRYILAQKWAATFPDDTKAAA